MIPTQIPELDEKQTEQILKDMKKSTSKEELELWKNAIKEAKAIKRR